MIKSKFRFLRTMVNKLEKNMNAQKGSQIGNPSIHIRPEKALFRKIKQSANTEQISLNLLVNRILRNYFNEVNPA